MTSNIDSVKEFWNKRPCNIRHSSKDLCSKEYFDEVEEKKILVEPHITNFTNFPQWNNKNVLEIGCGIGTVATLFAKNGANYTGVELSDVSLDITKKRFDVYGLKGEFYLGNSEHLSDFLPKQVFDLIYSFGVIHHSPNPEKIVSEIKKFADINTVIKVMLYAKNSWKNIMIESGLDQFEAQSACPVANTYSKEDIVELFKDFQITNLVQTHIFPYKIENYKKNIYIKQPWFSSMPKDMFDALEKNLGWHWLITAKIK